MERIKTELLSKKKPRATEFCILELFSINEQYYLYMSTGKKMTRELLKVYEFLQEADEDFEEAVLSKVNEGFLFIEDGETISIPSQVYDILTSHIPSNSQMNKVEEVKEEHRKLIL